MSALELAVIGFNIVFIAVILDVRAAVRKRGLFFGVTVEETFRDTQKARAVRRNYRLCVWAGAAFAAAALMAAHWFAWKQLVPVALVAQVAAGIVGWIWASRTVRPFATPAAPERTVALNNPEPGIPGGLAAVLLPVAGPIATGWYLWSRYDELPQRYPAHWNAAGVADRYTEKSFLAVFGPALMSIAVLALLATFVFAIQHGSRRGLSGEQAGWSARHRRLNLLMLIGTMWAMSVVLSIPSFGALIPEPLMRVAIPVSVGAVPFAIMLALIPLLKMTTESTGGTDATPEECWHWGTFYYNPDDPALMVEKRDGPGYTLNFANKASWAIMGLVGIVIIGAVVIAVMS